MANRLSGETSPYLQQHQDNPVDWYPWGEEALARARTEDKPILLSIGYSACHWCHVMAHESFEDPEVAEVMNRLFVNVKVDREERPDLDRIYQLAHQMLSRRPGGWPLTVMLTPLQVPFFAGTYFPKEPRHGLPGFPQLLGRLAAIYRERKDDIGRQSEALLESFALMQPGSPAQFSQFSMAPIEDALRSAKASFDPRYGGLGNAPKFPHPAELTLCLRRYAASGVPNRSASAGQAKPDEEALRVAAYTLEQMSLGGIYDQLGGGFCRYSVDERWIIPHFEKMLYDNGPLLALAADCYCATRNPLFARVAEETAAWVMREMQSAEGGYYSSLDADSEHEEGKFYVWTPDEVRSLLSPQEYEVVAPYYGLEGLPNFEGSFWHLHVTRTLGAVAKRLSVPVEECDRLLSSARQKLLAARELRVRPGRDEKILTSWNALMISGMARAARVFGKSEWIASARRSMEFIRRTMWKNDRLLATCRNGKAHLNAYLDDYAYLIAAAIELCQAEFDSGTLRFATDLAQVLLDQFEDRQALDARPGASPAGGGFFFTSHDHEKLIHRSKSGYDDSVPSGNGVAALALNRLSYLCGEPRYAQAAERTLSNFYPSMCDHAQAFPSLVMALEEILEPPRAVILRGREPELTRWKDALSQRYDPHTMVIAVPCDARDLPPVLDKPVTGGISAWVCEGFTCLAPISDLGLLIQHLDAPDISPPEPA